MRLRPRMLHRAKRRRLDRGWPNARSRRPSRRDGCSTKPFARLPPTLNAAAEWHATSVALPDLRESVDQPGTNGCRARLIKRPCWGLLTVRPAPSAPALRLRLALARAAPSPREARLACLRGSPGARAARPHGPRSKARPRLRRCGQPRRGSRLDHEPGEVIGGQPVAQVRRQEQGLVSVAAEEVLGPCLDGPKRAGQQGVCATASTRCDTAPHRWHASAGALARIVERSRLFECYVLEPFDHSQRTSSPGPIEE